MTAALRPAPAPPRATDALVLRLDRAGPLDAVGGKAHNLRRAIELKLPVPDGIVLTTRALELHLQSCAVGDTAPVDAIRAAILDAPLHPRLRDQLHDAARPVLATSALAVRSSGADEDSAERSFAGQHDSFLDVTTPEALESSVRRCWASAWSDRALAYRAHGAATRRVERLAVIVQRQVRARAAGVLFTRAGAGHDHTALVEWTPGLGDRLVAGSVTPARFLLDLHTGAAERLHDAGAGDDDTRALVLAPGTLAQLRHAAVVLDRGFGGPQDVEWALDEQGVVHVVQARPVTAPLPEAMLRRPDARVTWSNANINENYPAPISPLLYSIMTAGYANYFRNLAVAFGLGRRRLAAIDDALGHIVGVHGARPYYNLSNVHTVLRAAPFGDALVDAFNRFTGTSGIEGHDPRVRGTRIGAALELGRMALRTAWVYATLGRRVRRFEAGADDFAARTAPAALARSNPRELRLLLAGFMEIRRHRWTDAALADAGAMVTYALLGRLVSPETGHALLSAIPNLASERPVQRLWELSRTVREDMALRALFARDSALVVRTLRGADGRFASFRAAMEDYLEHYGFRCSEELMLTVPGFREQPEALVDAIRAYAALDGDSPATALAARLAAHQALLRRLTRELRRRRVSAWLPFVSRARAIRVVLHATQGAIACRERVRLKQALLYGQCRALALAIGARLRAAGTIVRDEDVFWLTVTELDELLAGTAMLPHHVSDLVALRRRAHADESRAVPPDTLVLAEGDYRPRAGWSAGAATARPEDELAGTSACGGRASGRAVVLHDVRDIARLRRGDILVTRQTDPGWAPVFFLIAGLVVERGGMLSHGAIVAREFGIPCVVAVPAATERIRDGSRVTVDGDDGRVTIHEDEASDRGDC